MTKRNTNVEILARSPRAAIKQKCISCVYDPQAVGSKLVQTTLCSCRDCPLWPFRPTTKAPITWKVLTYYGIRPDDPCLNGLPAPKTGPVVAFPSKTPRSGSTGPVEA